MAYLSGISSVSNSSFTSSYGSNDTALNGSEPLQINSSVFLNNNITYGSRLEMLQQIANRVQRDCVNGEDKLALARMSLQSDVKRLESGIQFLNESEIAGYLLECENILRQQVVDIQILLDGKFPFADQLVQRVSKLRDDLLALRAECSSVYSKGRTLTTEQTKMMISGITQSLNSGFPQNLNSSLTPALTPGGLGTPASTFTSSLTPCLTPSLSPSLTPGLQPASVQGYMGSGGGGIDPGSLMHLKHMQIRKPLQKSSLADPNMTEEEVNMKFVQDLLSWVAEMQMQLDRSEWGSDLPSVETHLDNHKTVHRAIEDFQMSLKEAKLSEIQMNTPLKLPYSEKLNQLEKQYERLLSCSRERQSHLESLHEFVSQATRELIWLNEREEEEVAFDWSDRNSNISRKRDYHADLMRELDEKEDVIKSVQDKAERLLLKNHPARLTIEAYRAAMQTQWSWILQLCSCVEQHLKENAVYFEFFNDAKESMDYLKNLQDAVQRKYSCDRSSILHRLEDLIQESMDEKEQLLQYRSTVAGLVGRAKSIVQLRPRNPDNALRSSIPVKAICDYRQIEITIYRDDECVLANNAHRAKWKVINPAGNEAMVPSVCFTVPPPNKEAADVAARIEQLYQNVLALWHHSHINMKSVVSWHYLMADIRAIRNWNVASFKTMLPGEHQQVLGNLQSHFEEFLEDSEESEVFTVADCAQLERDVAACKEYYQELLQSAEREEHEESVYNHYISELRNFRMHLEAHEEHLIRQIRTPLERDDLEQSLQRISEQERKTAELNTLKEDLDVIKEKCELFLRQAAGFPSASTLSSELTVLVQSMSQVYSMSSIYMDKLKTVSLVVKHSQNAEALVKAYESKLYEEDAMNSDLQSIETVISTLKQWRTEIDEKQEVFHDMEDELQKARVISERMFKVHNERDFDLDWHKEKADQLNERWHNVHSQIDNRLRDLDGISKSLKHYRDSFSILSEWVQEMEAEQLEAQENKPEDSKALAELLNKQKVLVAEIEQKQSRIDECQKYSEQYSSAIKDYELQLMTFRAMVDSQHKSPLKKRRMQSSSDTIQQEFMDLRTRYTALVTLMTQFVKFASETLKRTEDEENVKAHERAESAKWTENMELQKAAGDVELSQLKQRIQEQDALLGDRQAELEKQQAEIKTLQRTIDDLIFQKSQFELDIHQYRTKLEMTQQDKAACEQELIHTKQLFEQSEAKWALARKKLEALVRQTNEDLMKQNLKLKGKINMEEDAQEVFQSQVQAKQLSASTGDSEPQPSTLRDYVKVEVLQQKLEELVMVQKRAEMAEEKAQSYKKLLDDSNNRVKKLQMDMETERINMRQKSEDLQQEMLNMKKSINELQEEIRSLQRTKSSLEQHVFFHNTEVEGLKEQLKLTQGELHKKSCKDQDNIHRISDLEEEVASKQAVIDQLKFKSTELKRINMTLDSDLRGLLMQTESLEKERALSDQKIMSLKSEIQSWKQQLQTAKEESSSMRRSEQALQLKCKDLENEIQRSESEASQLQRKLDELKETNREMEKNLKNVRAKLDQVTVETESKDQQIKILKSQVESSKSQVKIIEEELNKKTQHSHELQMTIQGYNEEVKKMSELQQKNRTLHSNVENHEREISTLKSDLNSLLAEKSSANQKVHMQNSEINNLKMMLKNKNAELENESAENRRRLDRVKALEDELFSLKNSLKGLASSSEKIAAHLKQEVLTLQNDKKAAEKNVENLNVKVSELSATLQRVQDDLADETKEREVKESMIMQLESELETNKVTMKEIMFNSDKSQSDLQLENRILKREKVEALGKSITSESEIKLLRDKLQRAQAEVENVNVKLSGLSSSLQRAKEQLADETNERKANQLKMMQLESELQKTSMTMKEVKCSSDKNQLNVQRENMTLKRERAEALEKSISMGSENRLLKEKLQRTQREAEQNEKENSALKVRSQQMEEQLEKCKKMLEELKSKLDLQKEGYEKQLLLVQREIERKLTLVQSEITSERGVSKQHSAELAEVLRKYFKHEVQQIRMVECQQQMDKRLQTQVDKLEQERTKLGRELTKAKSQVSQLEVEKIQLNSELASLRRSHQPNDSAKVRQLLADSERRLTQKESEAKSLREQIESHLKEIKSLQEKLLKLEVMTKTGNQKQEVIDSSRHVKTVTVIRKVVSTEEDRSSNAFPQRDVQNNTYKIKPAEFMTSTTQGYMALCGLMEQQPKEKWSTSRTRRDETTETCEAENTSENSATKLLYSTVLKLPDLKGSSTIQHLIKLKLLDEEILRKVEAGRIPMEEVQALLAPYIGKPTALAGVYVESSKKKISFLEAAEKGFLAKTYAHEFLETQAATGSLTDLTTGQRYSVVDALKGGIIETGLKDKLLEAEKAVRGYAHDGKKLSVFEAMEERILDKYKGRKILEAQVATGGLIAPDIGFRMPASVAVDQGFLNEETLQSLCDPVSNPKGFHNPDTGQKAYYSDLLKTCLYDIDGGVFLFPLGDRHVTNTSPTSCHRVSVISSGVGTEMSAYEAFKGKHIDKRTYLFLSQQESEWQEKPDIDASGSPCHIITDVKNGRQLCLESALSQRFLETTELESYRRGRLTIHELADIIFSRMVVVEDVSSPVAGLWDVSRRRRLSVLQGFQEGFTDRASALRLLEAQACTGGICDPASGDKVPLSVAVKRGLLDESLAEHLKQFEEAFNGISHPKTGKTLSVSQALQENLFPRDVAFRCFEFQLLTGGLINPDTHDRVSLEEVIQSGLVDKVTAAVLKDEKFYTKSLSCPKTKRRISFREALERSVYDCHTGLRLLEAAKVLGLGPKSTFHYVCAYK